LIADIPNDTAKVVSVTPITTVLSAADTPEQKNQVLSALGISGSLEEALTTDHWALAESGDTTAQAVQATNQQVAVILQTAATMIASDTSTNEVTAPSIANAVAEQVTAVATATGTINLSSNDIVTTVLTNAVQAADSETTISAEVVSAVATSIAEVNTLIGSDSLDPTSAGAGAIIETAQTTLQASVTKVTAGTTDTATFTSNNSTSALFINNAALASLPDFDSDGIADVADLDDDADGVADTDDAFPLDTNESVDTDADGVGNNTDTDDDGDGVTDADDAFPLNAAETLDTDTDGIGNNADTDDDADGVADADDAFPLDADENLDTDADGIGNNADTDDDGDGVTDADDAFPLNAAETLDTDTDGIGNNADTDDDNDGVTDADDAFPLDPAETLDTDTDGIGNNTDTDDDNDGVADSSDAYPLNADIHTLPTATNATLDLNLLPQLTNLLEASMTSTSQNNRAVTYSVVSNPTSGTLTLTDSSTGAFSYSTNATTATVDAFTFKVNDGFADSLEGTVYINLKTDPLYKHQWHLDNTGQTSFASNAGTAGADLNVDKSIVGGRTGDGVVIAIVDDGLEITHEDLADNVIPNGSYNYLLGDSNDPTPVLSSDAHGTAVAGIIAAKGWNNIGIRGVAPNASLRAFNLLANNSAAGSYTNEANALGAGSSELFADVSIFNMSYGGPNTSLTPTYSSTVTDQLYAGVTSLRGGKGAIYVASAGNDYYTGADGSSNYSYCGDGANSRSYKLGCYDVMFDKKKSLPYIINVAGLDADGIKARSSTPGSAVWISAPAGDFGTNSSYASGVYPDTSISIPYKPAITTTDLSTCSRGSNSSASSNINAFNDSDNPHSENTNCNYRNTMSGTSSAAPMVSGVVALMLEANPELTWRDVKHILATTANQADSSFSATATNGINYVGWVTNSAGLNFHPWYGFGAIDATAAVNSAATYTAGALGEYSFSNWLLASSTSSNLGEGTLNTLSLTESGAGTVEHIQVAIKISHAEPNHLGFQLESPAGTIATLLPPFTALSTDLSTSTWAYLPTNAFYGETKAGTWTLRIYDHYAGHEWHTRPMGH
jgi:subtilisin family serine protease